MIGASQKKRHKTNSNSMRKQTSSLSAKNNTVLPKLLVVRHPMYTHRTFPATTARVCPDLAEGNSCLRIVGGFEKDPPACTYTP